ncbi:MAG: LPS export ABC transporter ATP-binding protein [Candidatus Caenarcaniphilales bacterium]|nr:LPS export ABC transporter ATP-binding protein [Candidatus Caenarcaniphilales bacterium]
MNSETKAVLKAKKLIKSYNSRKVVNAVDFEVTQGEAVALLGPNGAGKTTCFDMVVGLVKPDKGMVFYDDKNITKLKIHERAKLGISYLTQEPSAFRQLTVMDNLKLVLELTGLSEEKIELKAKSLLEEFGIYRLRESYAISLSGGERRRLEIARALALDPKFILLDEPFTGIDPVAILDIQGIIKDLCKRKNIGLLITDHNPNATLNITDRAYIIYNGDIIKAGNSEEIAHDNEVKEKYLGTNFKLY